jgi:hypothetical protein
MQKNKLVNYFVILSVFLMLISILLYYFGFEMKTFVWHRFNAQPKEWNDLKIHVPGELVGCHKNDDFIIYKLSEPTEIAIIFRKMPNSIGESYNFKEYYAQKGFHLIEKDVFNLPIGETLWVKGVSKNDGDISIEAIYLLSRPIRITFIGQQKNRDVFEDIVRNLNWN